MIVLGGLEEREIEAADAAKSGKRAFEAAEFLKHDVKYEKPKN